MSIVPQFTFSCRNSELKKLVFLSELLSFLVLYMKVCKKGKNNKEKEEEEEKEKEEKNLS